MQEELTAWVQQTAHTRCVKDLSSLCIATIWKHGIANFDIDNLPESIQGLVRAARPAHEAPTEPVQLEAE